MEMVRLLEVESLPVMVTQSASCSRLESVGNKLVYQCAEPEETPVAMAIAIIGSSTSFGSIPVMLTMLTRADGHASAIAKMSVHWLVPAQEKALSYEVFPEKWVVVGLEPSLMILTVPRTQMSHCGNVDQWLVAHEQ